MKLSLSWLKNYVPVSFSVDELVKKLTMAGMEIEHVERLKDDTVLDIEITPNRPDCLSVWGLAREVAAVTGQRVSFPKIKKFVPPLRRADISVEDKEACLRYVGVEIRDVHIKHPDIKMSRRLESVGLRSISNVVDVTNFLLMETGQPMHAFDLDKLEGGKIVVRRAREDETIVTLDGEERKLDSSVLVIADAVKPVAIAGIKGGRSAEVTWETRNILLESAYFDPVLVRRTSRKLKLGTDSSYRFERGVDYAMVEKAAHRAVDLMLDCAGGKIFAYQDVQTSLKFAQPRKVTVSLSGVQGRIGCRLSKVQFKSLLKALGCEVKPLKTDVLTVTVPTFRNDLKQEVDFDEEIARLTGYDQIPSTLPSVPLDNVVSDVVALRQRSLRGLCLAQGLDEVVAFSTMPEDFLAKTKMNAGSELLQIVNPLSQEQKIMRPSALPALLQIVQANFNNGQKHLRLFEIGKIYGQKKEQRVLSLLLIGAMDWDWRQTRKNPYQFSDLKGAVENILERNHVLSEDVAWKLEMKGLPFLDPLQSAIIEADQRMFGFLGRISDAVVAAWDIKTKDIWYAEIDLDWLLARTWPVKHFESLAEYPAIVRDLSLAVKNGVTFQQIQRNIAGHKIDILQLPAFFRDEYLGESVPDGHRALTLSLTYQAPDRTLTDEDVDKVHARVVQSLADHLGAIQR